MKQNKPKRVRMTLEKAFELYPEVYYEIFQIGVRMSNCNCVPR
jgi:hypothetical protein